MKVYDSIVDTIGDTPLVKLHTLSTEKVTFYAKVEAFNPGRSSKDRIAVPMIDDAEKKGLLKPGGTIIEATSGNTGLALALVGIRRGYKVILVMPDKMSPEKINLVKAMGCEVIVTPTEVEPDDPRSYYSVAERLAKETPNSFWARQYWNESNPLAHYNTTGPEVWRDTDGRVTHFVAGVGTGGTISGTGRFLKEKNPEIKVIAPDPDGSILAHYHEYKNTDVQAHGYKVEGVGEDIIPTNVDFDVIDKFVKVNDQESFEWTRRLAREEGLMVGGSAGLAVSGAVKYRDYPDGSVVVILLPDTGERYLGKIFNDMWMRKHGFLPPAKSIPELLDAKPPNLQGIVSISKRDTWRKALDVFRKFENISQVLVGDGAEFKVLHRKQLYHQLIRSDLDLDSPVDVSNLKEVGSIDISTSLDHLRDFLRGEDLALVKDKGQIVGLVTVKDVVENSGL